MYEFMCTKCRHSGASRRQRVSDFLELDLLVVVNQLIMRVLGNQPGSVQEQLALLSNELSPAQVDFLSLLY